VARFLTLAGRAREGFDLVDDAIRMAEELGDVELLADSLNTRGVARVMLGDARWIEDAERSLELALEATSWRAARAYINLGSTLLWEAGEIARAERVMREGLGFAEGIGAGLAARWSRGNLVESLFHLGRWDEALAFADEEIANPEPHYMQPDCRRYRALIRLARGDERGALDDIEAGLEQSRSIRDPQDFLPALAWRAFCLVRTGDVRGAARSLNELLELQDTLEQPDVPGPSVVLLAHAIVELKEAPALQFSTTPKTPWQGAALAIVEGDAALAADQLAAIGARAFEAQARLEAARRLGEAGRTPDAEAQLAGALRFYREVGATAAVRSGEALLRAAS
jgi:tetratricopeptide (TPR) repeat protein